MFFDSFFFFFLRFFYRLLCVYSGINNKYDLFFHFKYCSDVLSPT